ncbi:predicted protein, partial [Arabidopsis lyrata subsp. lyrata]
VNMNLRRRIRENQRIQVPWSTLQKKPENRENQRMLTLEVKPSGCKLIRQKKQQAMMMLRIKVMILKIELMILVMMVMMF